MSNKTIKDLTTENEALGAENEALKAQLTEANAKAESAPNKPLVAELPKELKGFELNGWVGSPRQYFGKFGIVDLTKLTEVRANALVAGGFKKIKKKG